MQSPGGAAVTNNNNNNNVGGGTGVYGGAQQQPPSSSTSPPPQSMMMSPPQQQRINHQHQHQQQQQQQHQHLQHQLMMYKAQREREQQQQQQLQTNNYQRQGNNNNYAQQPGYAPATQQQTQAQTQQQIQHPITTAIPQVQSYSPPPVSPVYGPLNSGIPLSGSDVHYQFLTAEKRLVPGVARAALNPSLPYLNLQPRLLSSSGTTLCHGLHGTIEFYSRDLSTHFSVQPTSSQLQGLAVSAFNMIAYSTQDGSLGIVQKYEPCRFTEILHPSPSKTVLSNLVRYTFRHHSVYIALDMEQQQTWSCHFK
ncbi:hypothetical protein Pelo_15068 [Pelomyxa schiedti]|nr:hypothetical protein Pelo_15068 [Pelomyxa schiedti]